MSNVQTFDWHFELEPLIEILVNSPWRGHLKSPSLNVWVFEHDGHQIGELGVEQPAEENDFDFDCFGGDMLNAVSEDVRVEGQFGSVESEIWQEEISGDFHEENEVRGKRQEDEACFLAVEEAWGGRALDFEVEGAVWK